MQPMTRSVRGLLGLAVLALLVALLALPTLAADPSGTPTASAVPVAASAAASAEPEESKAPKPSKAPKAEKAPEVAVTVTGTVATRTDAEGETEYTITVDGQTLTLDAGPSWFFKDKHPLKPYVGKRVTIVGEQRVGETELDVETVDGTRLREPGKPPWAGGWKQVGEGHPGWTQEKWDRWQAKLKLRGSECFPPGQCKDKPAKSDDPGE
jgi:hypothetical protein